LRRFALLSEKCGLVPGQRPNAVELRYGERRRRRAAIGDH
jgi:hypothetical protein